MTRSERHFSDDPYSDLPCHRRSHARRTGSRSELALGVLCAEAQADGVPCFELGRECETCELAYRWYVEQAEQTAQELENSS
jgi:hypothetical protein